MISNAQDWCNKGGQLLETDPRLGQRFISRCLLQIPDSGIALFNLGIGLHQQRKIKAAIRAYKFALMQENAPVRQIQNNLSQDLLLSGNFREGLKYYETRFKKGQNEFFLSYLGQPWSGANLSKSKPRHLILVAEQGLGDTLQFCRYALILQRQNIDITLFCQKVLTTYLKNNTDIKNITHEMTPEEVTQEGTTWCPLMSLPHRLGTEKNSIPSEKSYLRANKDLVAEWNKKLNRREGYKLIGLHWQGNPTHENSLYSRGRSMSFVDWVPLNSIDGIEFVSLQKKAGQEQLCLNAGLDFVKGQSHFEQSLSFEDTSAVIKNCDLIITADSGIVHIAGGLGIQTWVALRWIPEWRWLLNGDKTDWYPSLRLFRQQVDGDWHSVVLEIKSSLISWLKN